MTASVQTDAWYTNRITALQTAIEAHETAIAAVVGGAQSYTLDTGQTRQTVTKSNLTELRKTLAFLENQLAVLEARCGRTAGVSRVTPGW